jgi:hypothetical protein
MINEWRWRCTTSVTVIQPATAWPVRADAWTSDDLVHFAVLAKQFQLVFVDHLVAEVHRVVLLVAVQRHDRTLDDVHGQVVAPAGSLSAPGGESFRAAITSATRLLCT